ncbi:MAG: hypothetical protein HKL90_11555 [Elusimicrobia bacterium]|nr:hypothetical protein [Elusimicrobiota bacterium]
MTERLRAPLAALAALLIGGEFAARGSAALTDVGGFLFPYVGLFLMFELLRARRRLGDAEAFLVGAAVGLLRDGVYAKTLQEGALPFGLDTLGAVFAVFDWGMTAVLALHAVDALLPRVEESRDLRPEAAAAGAIAAGAAAVYALMTLTGRYRYERMIGSFWLLDDLIFIGVAAALTRRAWRRATYEEPLERDGWLWALGALCAWLPGMQIIYRSAAGESGFFAVFFMIVWTLLVGGATFRLWSDRAYVDATPRRASRAALGLALWRLAGCAILLAVYGPAKDNLRAVGPFQVFVDLPTRAAFCWLFFSGRLAV